VGSVNVHLTSSRHGRAVTSTRRSHLAGSAVHFLGRAQAASALAVSALPPADPLVLIMGRASHRFVRQLKAYRPAARVAHLRHPLSGHPALPLVDKSTRVETEALPYPDQTFDAVVILFSLQYLRCVPLAFSEMARVLAPGGILVVSDVTAEDFFVHDRRFNRIARFMFEPGPAIADFYGWLESAGLRPVEVASTLLDRGGVWIMAEKNSNAVS
jgi:SAM-dependent methyltransferase